MYRYRRISFVNFQIDATLLVDNVNIGNMYVKILSQNLPKVREIEFIEFLALTLIGLIRLS